MSEVAALSVVRAVVALRGQQVRNGFTLGRSPVLGWIGVLVGMGLAIVLTAMFVGGLASLAALGMGALVRNTRNTDAIAGVLAVYLTLVTLGGVALLSARGLTGQAIASILRAQPVPPSALAALRLGVDTMLAMLGALVLVLPATIICLLRVVQLESSGSASAPVGSNVWGVGLGLAVVVALATALGAAAWAPWLTRRAGRRLLLQLGQVLIVLPLLLMLFLLGADALGLAKVSTSLTGHITVLASARFLPLVGDLARVGVGSVTGTAEWSSLVLVVVWIALLGALGWWCCVAAIDRQYDPAAVAWGSRGLQRGSRGLPRLGRAPVVSYLTNVAMDPSTLAVLTLLRRVRRRRRSPSWASALVVPATVGTLVSLVGISSGHLVSPSYGGWPVHQLGVIVGMVVLMILLADADRLRILEVAHRLLDPQPLPERALRAAGGLTSAFAAWPVLLVGIVGLLVTGPTWAANWASALSYAALVVATSVLAAVLTGRVMAGMGSTLRRVAGRLGCLVAASALCDLLEAAGRGGHLTNSSANLVAAFPIWAALALGVSIADLAVLVQQLRRREVVP